MSAPICFVDCETDGVHADRRVWEIAMIRREPNGISSELSVFVAIDLSTADPFGLQVGGFYDRHPVGLALSQGTDESVWPRAGVSQCFITTEGAARLVARWTHGAHIAGAVPNFDTHVFDRLLRAHGLIPAWHYHLIDVEALAVGFLGRGDGGIIPLPWASDDLSRGVGVEPPGEDDRHTALGDARWARDLFYAILGEQP